MATFSGNQEAFTQGTNEKNVGTLKLPDLNTTEKKADNNTVLDKMKNHLFLKTTNEPSPIGETSLNPL